MQCPKCGYERQSRDDAFVPVTECPACGIVYSKHDYVKVSDSSTAAAEPSPHLRPSPLDPASLRKARERVEKRLRDKLGSRMRDGHHAQTLKLAKRLTAEQVRIRREERKQTHVDAQPAEPAQAPGDPLNPSINALLPEAVQAASPQTEANILRQNPDSGQAANADPSPAQAAAALSMHAQPETAQEDPEPALNTETADAKDCPAGQTDSVAALTSNEDQEAVVLDDIVVSFADKPEAVPKSAAEEPVASTLQPEEVALPENKPIAPAAHATAMTVHYSSTTPSGRGLARLFPIVAWMILSAGLIGAVLSWTTIDNVEAGLRVPMSDNFSALPLGLLLGFAYLATGVLGFAFFWVSSLISTQLKDIRRLLTAQPDSLHAGQE